MKNVIVEFPGTDAATLRRLEAELARRDQAYRTAWAEYRAAEQAYDDYVDACELAARATAAAADTAEATAAAFLNGAFRLVSA